jgi:hypothetical protein
VRNALTLSIKEGTVHKPRNLPLAKIANKQQREGSPLVRNLLSLDKVVQLPGVVVPGFYCLVPGNKCGCL